MSKIKCGCCGREVADTAYTCPYCGYDVREIKARGNGCGNCTNYAYCSEYGWHGPSGYPCLEWDEDGYVD